MEHQGKDFMGCDYNIDETYIKVKGQWYYLYRAVDKTGQTIDFCSPSSGMRRFFSKRSAATACRRNHHRRECGQ